MEPIARLEHVTKKYGSVIALDAVSVTVSRGVTAILGPNGAGKSTMVDIMAGLRRPSAGHVEVFGGDPASPAVRIRMGLTPQATALPWRLTAAETLDLLAAHYPRSVPRRELAEQLDLGAFVNRRNAMLSGGQRRRVALAAALVGAPELLLLDEPTVGLDPDSRDRMWAAITAAAAAGAAVVLTTHDMAEAEHLAGRVVVVAGGKVARAGTVDDVCAEVGLHLVDVEVSEPLPPLPVTGPADRVEVKGTRTHVYTADPDATVRALVHAGVAFRGIRVHRVGLETAIRAITDTPDPVSPRVPERVA